MSSSLATRLLTALVTVCALGLGLSCVVAWIPVWPCALAEHFRLQCFAGGMVVVVAAAALRLRGYFDLALVGALVHALPLVADLTRTASPIPSGGTSLRVLVLNVHTESTSFARVRQLIVDENPDIVGLLEVDRRWLEAIGPALVTYPGRIEAPRADNFGVALYARGELHGSADRLGTPLPSVVASVHVQGMEASVVVTHPLPPMNGAAIAQQLEQFGKVAAHARGTPMPMIVMGDLNATPWSRPFEYLLGHSGLCDTRAGFGLQSTFPAASQLLRIPIDHVLVSCSIGVRDRRVGRDVGSDHLPVIVDLVLPGSVSQALPRGR